MQSYRLTNLWRWCTGAAITKTTIARDLLYSQIHGPLILTWGAHSSWLHFYPQPAPKRIRLFFSYWCPLTQLFFLQLGNPSRFRSGYRIDMLICFASTFDLQSCLSPFLLVSLRHPIRPSNGIREASGRSCRTHRRDTTTQTSGQQTA